jgi:hypothetical protein
MPSRPQQVYSDGYWASCGIYMYSIMWYGQHHGLCTAPSIFSSCIQTVAGIATNPSCFSTFLYLCASPSIQWHAVCVAGTLLAHCLRPLVSVHSMSATEGHHPLSPLVGAWQHAHAAGCGCFKLLVHFCRIVAEMCSLLWPLLVQFQHRVSNMYARTLLTAVTQCPSVQYCGLNPSV